MFAKPSSENVNGLKPAKINFKSGWNVISSMCTRWSHRHGSKGKISKEK